MRDTNINHYSFPRINHNSFPPSINHKLVYYNCNNYGHIARSYRSGGLSNEKDGTPTIIIGKRAQINRNLFSALMDCDVECYKHNNYGHISNNCGLPKSSFNISTSKIENKYNKIWRVNQKEEKRTKCKVALYSKNKNKRIQW